MLPKAVRKVSQELARLPGIGPKSAERLTLYMLRQPKRRLEELAEVISTLQERVRTCDECFNLAEDHLCEVCASQIRRRETICVTDDALAVAAIERTGAYDGRYHVLGGVLSPIDGVTPDQLKLAELFERVRQNKVTELIIALDHTMESEATVRYIKAELDDLEIKISRLARGLPTGGDIEFADDLTLMAAMSGRKVI